MIVEVDVLFETGKLLKPILLPEPPCSAKNTSNSEIRAAPTTRKSTSIKAASKRHVKCLLLLET